MITLLTNRSYLWLLLALIGQPLVLRGAEQGLPSSTDLRRAIATSLPFLEKRGVAWMGRKRCVSCHHTALLLWSYGEAEKRGFETNVDQTQLWLDWALTKQLSPREDGAMVGSQNLEGLSQLILGSRDNLAVKEDAKTFQQFEKMLLTGQQANGLWKAMGQLPTQKRPKEETVAVSSMWAVLALRASGIDQIAINASIESALKGLATSENGLSTEWWVLRMLVDNHSNGDPQKNHWIAELINRQNTNGGWAWITGDPSDALATGLALYGLHEAGVRPDNQSIRRAQRFLLATQNANGSWSVNSTKAVNKTEPIPTSVFLGSSWATIGLLKTIPNQVLAATGQPIK